MLSRRRIGRLFVSFCAGLIRATAAARAATSQPAVPTPSTAPAATRPTSLPTTHPSTRPSTRPAPFPDIDVNPLPTAPGDHKLRYHAVTGKHAMDMAVLLHLPPHYSNTAPKWPMILFLHGGGETGTDLGGIYGNGPMTILRTGANDAFAASCPFIVLCPQCPPRGQRWDQQIMIDSVVHLLDDVEPRVNADPNRVYLTGLSMGGIGTWRTAFQAADRFAAIAPMSAVAYKPELMADRLRYDDVWSVVGENDSPPFLGGTHQMQNALADNPKEIRFTYLLGNGHDAWWPTYASPTFYEWLLGHRRPDAAARAALDAASRPTTAPPTIPSTQPVATTRPSSSLPDQPGHYRLFQNVNVGDQAYEMDYLLYLPRTYRPDSPPPPVLFFFSEQGVIGPDWGGLCPHGPNLELAKPGSTLPDSFPFVVISPRVPIKCDWNTPGLDAALRELLDHVCNGLRVDRTRISLTGIDAGATVALRLATATPDRFAAVVPIQCFDHFNPAQLPENPVLPGWFFENPNHRRSVQSITREIAARHLDWQLSPLAHPPVASTDRVDTSPYADPALLDWLTAHRATAPSTTAPAP